MYKLKIKIPIYEVTCNIIITSDIRKTIQDYGKKKKWRKEWFLEDDENIDGYAVPDFSLFYSEQKLTPNLLSHEISHLVDFILEFMGIELVGETRAYLTGHISEKVFELVIKHNLLKWEKDLKKKTPIIKKPKENKDEKSDRLLQESNQNPGRSEEGLS